MVFRRGRWLALALFLALPWGPARPQESPIDVIALERRLAGLGFDPGPIDGIFDGKTRAALRDFQSGQGLKRTGQPDARTLAALAHPMPANPRPNPASGAGGFAARPAKPATEAPPPKAAPTTPVEVETLPPR